MEPESGTKKTKAEIWNSTVQKVKVVAIENTPKLLEHAGRARRHLKSGAEAAIPRIKQGARFVSDHDEEISKGLEHLARRVPRAGIALATYRGTRVAIRKLAEERRLRADERIKSNSDVPPPSVVDHTDISPVANTPEAAPTNPGLHYREAGSIDRMHQQQTTAAITSLETRVDEDSGSFSGGK